MYNETRSRKCLSVLHGLIYAADYSSYNKYFLINITYVSLLSKNWSRFSLFFIGFHLQQSPGCYTDTNRECLMSKNPLYKKTSNFYTKEVNYLERRLFAKYIPRGLRPSGCI